MNRLLLTAIAGIALVPNLSQGAAATPLYVNTGNLTRTGTEAPRIDAESFLNFGTFSIGGLGGGGIGGGGAGGVIDYNGTTLYPFQTYNTLNYTNLGIMTATPGFRFAFEDLSQPQFGRKWTANVVNGAVATAENASIYGENALLIAATNVVNRGVLGAGAGGILRIDAQNADLSHGLVLIGAQNGYGGVQDYPNGAGMGLLYSVVGTNLLNANFYNAGVSVTTPTFDATGNGMGFNQIQAANNLEVYWTQETVAGEEEDDPIVNTYHILFLANASANIRHGVRFSDDGSAKQVWWEKDGTNLLTGLAYTNDLFLTAEVYRYIDQDDKEQIQQDLNLSWRNPYPGLVDQVITDLPAETFDRAPGEEAPEVIYAAYSAELSAAPVALDTTIYGRTYTNMAGRVEISANELNLSDALIGGAGYVHIKATNNIIANANTRISAPYQRLDLASSTGNLDVRGLLKSAPEAFVGTVEAWSGFWTNKLDDQTMNIFYVTVVNANLNEDGMVPAVERATIKSANLTLADRMDLIGNFTADSQSLTIEPSGAVNLTTQDVSWNQGFTNLSYLTNRGEINVTGPLYLAGVQTQPWFTGIMERPYESIVSSGLISAQGVWTWSKYFESTGDMLASHGALSIRADDARINGGTLAAAASDIFLAGSKFVVNGQIVEAARSITMDVTKWLSDGSLEGTVDGEMAISTWMTGNGLQMVRMPEHASLLATEISATANPNAEVFIRWAGADRGCSSAGFSDNAAIGSLTLKGQNLSVFKFIPATGINALYVDLLILEGYQAGTNADGSPFGIELAPGFKIYFAKAMSGTNDVSATLNGKLNGAFCNVTDFAGWFSSATPVLAPSINTGGGDNGGGASNPPALTTVKLERPQETVPYAGSPTTVGKYYGLFYETAGVQVPSSGSIKLSVNSRGIYSGQVQVAGQKYAITGKLTADNAGSNVITRSGANPLTLSFEVDETGGKIDGTVTDGTWTATVLADLQPQGSAKNRSAFAGKYTFKIPATADMACGYGTALVTVSGNLVWSAKLGDGSATKQSSGVSREGVWSLYSSLSQGRGMAISWLQFNGDTLEGKVVAIIPDVSTNELTIVGSRYVQPRAAKRALELFPSTDGGHGRLTFEGAGIQNTTHTVVISNANKGRFAEGTRVTLQLVPGTGVFQGLFVNPNTGRPVAFRGVVLQEQNEGVGQFVVDGQVGSVLLIPPQ